MKKTGKLQTFDLSFFIGKSYFSNDGSQNLLIFQILFKTFTMPAAIPDTIIEWKATWLSTKNGH